MRLYKHVIATLLVLFSLNISAQIDFLQSGPMVGYSEMREVQLWVQTTESAEVKIVYWEKGASNNQYHTLPVVTDKSKAFSCKLLADKVLPDKIYEYEIWINRRKVELPYPCEFQSQNLWQWRTDAPDFKIALGSCSYISEERFDRPGKPYGGDYQIFSSIDSTKPDLMLWLGDNIYLREADWNTYTGIYHRYTHTRSLPEMQALLANTHNYAIWDDHDFGPNDADGSFIHKEKTLEAFKNFWANPTFGNSKTPGTYSQFSFNDCDFFLLDNRYNRTPKYNVGNREILGKQQREWLIAALKNSRATFKFIAVGGQFLSSAATYENHENYKEEKQWILKRLEEENIKGVVFLTGDRHHGEISKQTLANELVVYDITSSPLTSRAHKKVKEENQFRVENSLIKQRHFTTIEVQGKRKKRVLTIKSFGSDGELLFEHLIEQPKY